MTTPSESLLACDSVPLFADTIPVIIVELEWTVWAHMGSVTIVVKVVTIVMRLWTILCIGPSPLQRYQHALSHQAYTAVGWEASRCHHYVTLKVWEAAGVGCDIPGHLCLILQPSATTEAGLVAAGREEAKYPMQPWFPALLHPNSHRNYTFSRAKVYDICQRTRWTRCACHRGSEVLL